MLSQDDSFEPGPPAASLAVNHGDTGTLEHVERDHILRVLAQCGWRVRGPGNAAERLGLNASTLYSRMKKLGVQRKSPGPANGRLRGGEAP